MKSRGVYLIKYNLYLELELIKLTYFTIIYIIRIIDTYLHKYKQFI